MGFLTTALLVGLAGAGVAMFVKDSIKELDRKGTPCNFDNGISRTEFNEIVEKELKAIKRINDFSINDTVIRARVRSQSGISEWRFTVDFNDYGKITGNYWLNSKNNDSQIPESVAENIKKSIISVLNNHQSSECKESK